MRGIAKKKQCNPPLFFKGGTDKQKADWLTNLIAENLAQEYAGRQKVSGFVLRGSSKQRSQTDS
jgi:hypothetical protein